MLETVVLLIIAIGLGLYAFRELAPNHWQTFSSAAWHAARPASFRAVAAPTTSPAYRRDVAAEVAPSPRRASPARLVMLWLPLAIVALAFGLRVVDLTGSPFGFFCDEASNALDAYLIAHTLHDQHGALLPVYFQALSDYRGGFHIYWEVPFMALFGLTEFAVRFGSAVAGTLTVLLTYLFVSKAVNRYVGLAAAFLLATSPWHLMHSRVGWEEVSLPFVTALCLTALYYGLERPRLLPLAFLFGALGMYTYQPGRVFFPLFCLAWLIIYARPLGERRRYSLIGIIAGAIVLIPTAQSILDGTFFARLNQLNGPPQSFSAQLATFWGNYLAHFGPGFLFQTSTDIILRHYVRGFGMLYGFEAPFLILGVLMMIARHRRYDLLFLAWFLVYPVAAALVGPPISTRSITGVIVFQIAVAQGLYTAIRWAVLGLSRAVPLYAHRAALAAGTSTLALLVGLTATGQFMNAYLVDYPTYSSQWWGWQSGAGQIVAYFESHRAQYDRMLMHNKFNAPDELLRFYTQTDPAACAACGITDITNPAVVASDYLPRQRELWAVTPDDLALPSSSAFVRLPHRIVGRLTVPGKATSWLFIATGPGA